MLQGKPSETAMRVAVAVVAARHDEVLRPLARHPDEPYLEWFVRDHSDGARRYLEAWTSREDTPVIRILRKQMAGGAGLFTLLRKLYVEDEASAALAGGTRQLVVLGAGYDALALRLCGTHPDLRAFEVDHPATQQVKRRVLEARGAHPPNLALLPVDFATEAADDALAAAGHDPQRPTFVVCEGTLMYLAPAEADAVFALAARLSAPGSRFVFTWVDAQRLDAGGDAALLARALESTGEPLRSGRGPTRSEPSWPGTGSACRSWATRPRCARATSSRTASRGRCRPWSTRSSRRGCDGSVLVDQPQHEVLEVHHHPGGVVRVVRLAPHGDPEAALQHRVSADECHVGRASVLHVERFGQADRVVVDLADDPVLAARHAARRAAEHDVDVVPDPRCRQPRGDADDCLGEEARLVRELEAPACMPVPAWPPASNTSLS